MCLVALLFAGFAWAGDVVVDVLDIGQGDAVLIRTPAKKHILIDAADRNVNVVQQLQELGVDHLDLVIATHAHADHIGSMEQVIRALPPKVYVDSGLAHTSRVYQGLMEALEANPDIQYQQALTGMVFNLDDGAKLEILLPGATRLNDTRSDLNSNSVVTRLTHGEDCMLFTGDAEEPTERALLDQSIGECDVLKVAHHGSEHSSSAPFLRSLQPKVALISVGSGNRYGHPDLPALERLQSVGATVYRTDRDGRLTVTSSGKGVLVSTEKRDESHQLLAVRDLPGPIAAAAVGSPPATPGNDAPAKPGTALAAGGLAPMPGAVRPMRPGRTGEERVRSVGRDGEPAAVAASEGAPGAEAAAAVPAPVARPSELATSTEAGGETAVDGSAAPAAEACPFPASRRSEVYHEAECGNGGKISAENRVCYATAEAALTAGRRHAGCCHP